MNISAEVFLFFAIGLFVFGLVFVLLGLSSERGYWAQRDPAGNAKRDATKFHTIYHRAFKIAAGEYRAPLRIAAIGVVLWYFAVAAIVLSLLSVIIS